MANLRSLNMVILIGHLSTDVKFKWVKAKREGKDKEDTKGMASFNVATNETWGTKGKRVEYHRVIAWAKKAEHCNKYLKKGSFINLTGKLRHRSFKGNDGRRQWITEVNADEITFLDKKEDFADVRKEEAPAPGPKEIRDPFV